MLRIAGSRKHNCGEGQFVILKGLDFDLSGSPKRFKGICEASVQPHLAGVSKACGQVRAHELEIDVLAHPRRFEPHLQTDVPTELSSEENGKAGKVLAPAFQIPFSQ